MAFYRRRPLWVPPVFYSERRNRYVSGNARKRERQVPPHPQHHELCHGERLRQHRAGLRRVAHHVGRPERGRGDHDDLRWIEHQHRYAQQAHDRVNAPCGQARERAESPRRARPRGRGCFEASHRDGAEAPRRGQVHCHPR